MALTYERQLPTTAPLSLSARAPATSLSRRAPHVVRRDVVVLMYPKVCGVLGAFGHRQRLVVRPLILRQGQGVGVGATPSPTRKSANSNSSPSPNPDLNPSPDLDLGPGPEPHLHEGPVVVRGGPDDGLAFLGLHGETQVELGAAALLDVR